MNLESLDEYAVANPPAKGGRKCPICTVVPPEVRSTVAQAKGRHTAATITAWLRDDQGFAEIITRACVERHMREHVK